MTATDHNSTPPIPADAPHAEYKGKTYPIGLNVFNVYHHSDLPVLYIVDESDVTNPEQNLHIEITNQSNQTIVFKPLQFSQTEAPGPAKFHFAFRWRQGTFSQYTLDKVLVKTNLSKRLGSDWLVSDCVTRAKDSSLAIYLAYKGDTPAIETGDGKTLVLPGVSAAPEGGARATRVELEYAELCFRDKTTSFSGRRLQVLDIINHRGQKNIPLHAGMTGSNTILNDGKTSNTLNLGVFNPGREPIVLKGVSNSLPSGISTVQKSLLTNVAKQDAPSCLTIYFECQTKWGVADENHLSDIAVTVTSKNWQGSVAHSLQGNNPVWKFTPQTDFLLEAGGCLGFKIDGLISDKQDGQSYLYVQYQNIPGYWDGLFTVPIQKSPLIIHERKVGIGTNSPDNTLEIEGVLSVSKMISFPGDNAPCAFPSAASDGGIGTRIILWPEDSSHVPYALGVGHESLWYSVPSWGKHRWFVGATQMLAMKSSGLTIKQGDLTFSETGSGPPQAGSSGSGNRIVLKPKSSDVPYALGLSLESLWYSVPSYGTHRWFTGTTQMLAMDSSGLTIDQGNLTFSETGSGPPQAGSSGSGSRIVLKQESFDVPYALGIESGAMWQSVPEKKAYKWYVGTDKMVKLTDEWLFINTLNGIAVNDPQQGTSMIAICPNYFDIGMWTISPPSNGSLVFESAYAIADKIRFHIDGAIYATTFSLSDQRLKSNIRSVPAEEALSNVLKLQLCEFERRHQGVTSETSRGFVAQEVRKTLPHAVHILDTVDTQKKEAAAGFKDQHYLDYPAVLSECVGAIQALVERNNTLEKEIAELKSLIQTHKG